VARRLQFHAHGTYVRRGDAKKEERGGRGCWNCTAARVSPRIIRGQVKPPGRGECVLLNYGHPRSPRAERGKIFSAWERVNVEEARGLARRRGRGPKRPHFSPYLVIKKYWNEARRDIRLMYGPLRYAS